MKNMNEIVEQLKDIVSNELVGKVYDKDLAAVLDITQMNFATMKKRNKIPFVELGEFCARRKISMNWILFNQAPESLVEETNKYEMQHLGLAS